MKESDYTQIAARTKVIILAAGDANRMAPLSGYRTKPILPVTGVPLLERIIANYHAAGFCEFIIVFSKQEELILEYVQEMQKNPEIIISLVKQPKPMGMADAVLLTKTEFSSKDLVDNVPMYVTAGDILFSPSSIRQLFRLHLEDHASMTLALAYSPDPEMARGYGNVAWNPGAPVTEIVEKPGPELRRSDYYSEPMYVFNTSLFDYLAKVQPSKRGEKELQDAMQMIIAAGQPVRALDMIGKPIQIPEDGAYHLTYPRDFLAMNFRMLEEQTPAPHIHTELAQIDLGAKIGPLVFCEPHVTIGANSRMERSYLFHHARIGENCVISESVIGDSIAVPPNTILKRQILLREGVFPLDKPAKK
jgi:glucose-1-phosphate thymidylyltransferase